MRRQAQNTPVNAGLPMLTERYYGKGKSNKKRRPGAIAAVIAALIMLINIAAPAAVLGSSADGFDPKVLIDLETCEATEGYVSGAQNAGFDFTAAESRLLVEDSSVSIAGNRSLRIANGDLRKWSLNIEERQMRIGFSVKVGRNFENEFRFMISTQDSATTTESTGGTLFIIKNESGGSTFLYGSDNTRLYELKKDTVYRISALFTRGSNECTVTVNGEELGLKFKFRSAVYCITGMRIYVPDIFEAGERPEPQETSGTDAPDVTGSDMPGPDATPEIHSPDAASDYPEGDATGAQTAPEGGFPEPTAQAGADSKIIYETEITDEMTVLIDDIFISTKGRVYPQTYSIQEPGKMPSIDIPDETGSRNVRVFINTKEIDMSKTYVTDNTVYISAEQFLKGISMDYTYDKNERILTIANEKVRVSAHIPWDEITVNGVQVKLKYPVRTIDDVVMISPNFISEVFNAKVWWDAGRRMLVITSGSQKDDGILRIVGGVLYMNGEPYYEISFNKYDLFAQIWADYSDDPAHPSEEYREAAARKALSQLKDNGFNSIRVFCGADVPDLMYDAVTKGKYYEAMDRMFDLCDEYGIKLVVCMELISDNFVAKQRITGYGLVNKEETVLDLVASDTSESRTLLGQYIREFVDRYKSRGTVLMYEIVNEGNLKADVGNTTTEVCYSLGQLADFYNYCASMIHAVDGERIVTTGDSTLRSAQYHLFASTMAGSQVDDWTVDDEEQRLYALTLLNYGVDVISAHTYGLGTNRSEEFVSGEGGSTNYGFELLLKEAEMLGKPFYNGESNAQADPDGSDYVESVRNYLDSIIKAGVQLTHWWTFRSDRQGFDDGEDWRNDSGEVFDAIVQANAALKDEYVVNGVETENTNMAGWEADDEIIDPSKIISGATPAKETSNFEAVKWTLIIGGTILASCLIIVLLFRLRMRRAG